MGKKSWVSENYEDPHDLHYCNYHIGGYTSAFDNYFPETPKEGTNLNHQEDLLKNHTDINYIVLAMAIEFGKMPDKGWAKGGAAFEGIDSAEQRKMLDKVLIKYGG